MLNKGTKVDNRYEIIGVIGSGGQSNIYKVKDTRLDKDLVLKELRIDQSQSNQDIRDQIESFQREAKLLSKLNYDKLPRVYDYFLSNSNYYIVMDYIQGKDLGKIINEKRQNDEIFSYDEICNIAKQVIEVLKYLHNYQEKGKSKPIIFRDIKPSNIMIDGEDVVLLDFGIAKNIKQIHIDTKNPSGKVTKHTIIGTPGFAPIEQFQGIPDVRSDIHAFGQTLWSIITLEDTLENPLQMLMDRDDQMQKMFKLRQDLPDWFKTCVEKATEPKAIKRHQTIEEFEKEIKAESYFTKSIEQLTQEKIIDIIDSLFRKQSSHDTVKLEKEWFESFKNYLTNKRYDLINLQKLYGIYIFTTIFKKEISADLRCIYYLFKNLKENTQRYFKKMIFISDVYKLYDFAYILFKLKKYKSSMKFLNKIIKLESDYDKAYELMNKIKQVKEKQKNIAQKRQKSKQSKKDIIDFIQKQFTFKLSNILNNPFVFLLLSSYLLYTNTTNHLVEPEWVKVSYLGFFTLGLIILTSISRKFIDSFTDIFSFFTRLANTTQLFVYVALIVYLTISMPFLQSSFDKNIHWSKKAYAKAKIDKKFTIILDKEKEPVNIIFSKDRQKEKNRNIEIK